MQPTSGRELTARAFVTGAGDMHLVTTASSSLTASSEFVIHGNVCCEAEIDKQLDSHRYLADRNQNARVRATVEGDTFTGDVRIRGDNYQFSLNRSVRYDEVTTLADLAGTYTRQAAVFLGPNSTYTITLDPSGQLNGSHTNGCIYSGTASLADPPANLVALTVELSNCPRSILGSVPQSGRYSGFGILARDVAAPSDAATRTHVFIHSLVGPTWLGQQAVEKN